MNLNFSKWLSLAVATLPLCGALPAAAQDVDLKPGDVVRVSVYGQDDLETTVRISQDGNISFPLIGEVSLQGLSVRAAEQRLEQRLAGGQFVTNPQVTIFVEERFSTTGELVTVLGAVNRPGRFEVSSLSNEGAESVVGVLAMAGGVSENAADYILLAKNDSGGSANLRIDLNALIRAGDLSHNHPVAGGDILLVPRMEVVFVYGAVASPGRFRLEPGMTVRQAISVSGGLTERGTEKGLSVRRRDANGGARTVDVRLEDTLIANDVVVVNESLF